MLKKVFACFLQAKTFLNYQIYMYIALLFSFFNYLSIKNSKLPKQKKIVFVHIHYNINEDIDI